MNLNLDIPEERYDQARSMADAHDLAVEDVFRDAFVEQFSAWQRLRERAGRGNRDQFLAVLGKVPDVEPEEFDRI